MGVLRDRRLSGARSDASTRDSTRSRPSARTTSTCTSALGRSRRCTGPAYGTRRSRCTRTSATPWTTAGSTAVLRGARLRRRRQIHASRGDVARSDQIVQIIAPLMSPASARLYPWLLRLHVMRGELDAARALERPTAWRVHATEAYEAESERAWAIRDPNGSELVGEMRPHAAETARPRQKRSPDDSPDVSRRPRATTAAPAGTSPRRSPCSSGSGLHGSVL